MNKHYFQLIGIIALLAAVLLVVGAVGAAGRDMPVVKLSTTQSTFSTSQQVLVTVTISNPTRNSVRILKWFTPSEGVEEALFMVRRDGTPVAYIGAVYKRPAITGSDYITLKAGESLTRVVNLGDYYDLSAGGNYEILYSVASTNLFNEKATNFKIQDGLSSAAIKVKIEGKAGKGKPTPLPTPPPGGNAFDACTTVQQAALVTARGNALDYSNGSVDYFTGIKEDSVRYDTWFGTFDSGRVSKVKTHFTAIAGAFDTAGITFYCGCKQNYYAYVYPNRPYEIFVCKVFWTAPAIGTDSKAGTLIHEMSHFTVVAGTSDYVYGQTGAMDLASSDPAKAIMNADNHEYFAENTPFKP